MGGMDGNQNIERIYDENVQNSNSSSSSTLFAVII